MDNYEFCVQWVLKQGLKEDARILDYGCGEGKIVKKLRDRGVDAFGCDVFYGGGNYSLDPELLKRGWIRKMEGDAIPFEGESFDLIVNNQVMEHVRNLDKVLAEIHRVLKLDGRVLSIFPDKGVWREGHCGVPFLHWFPKGSRLRIFYAALCRKLGLGYFKGDKSAIRWSSDFCEWLDNWTHYRSKREIANAYGKYFDDICHMEEHYLQQKLGRLGPFASWLPTAVQRFLTTKVGSLVFVARKRRALTNRPMKNSG